MPREIEAIPLKTFPFDRPTNPRIDEALARFVADCNSFSPELLDQIPEKAAALRTAIQASLAEEWGKHFHIRRNYWLEQLTRELTAIGERLAQQAVNQALAEVGGLSLQRALGYTSAESFCRTAIDRALGELARQASTRHDRYEALVPQPLQIVKGKIQNDVRTKTDECWQRKRTEAQQWQAARDEQARLALERQNQERCEKERQAREEAQRQLELEKQRVIERQNAAELERKLDFPENLKEIVEVSGAGPFAEPLWINAGGMAGLPYRVTAWSERESRLRLANNLQLRARKVRVTRVWNPKTKITWWTETAQLGSIECYFDGATMEIVFERSVSLGRDEAIYLDLPPHTDIANVDFASSGWYRHWREEPGVRKDQVAMGVAGTYTRGPRLQADHH